MKKRGWEWMPEALDRETDIDLEQEYDITID